MSTPLEVPTDQPHVIDQDLVEQIKAQTLIDAGFTSQSRSGIIADEKAMHQKVLEVMVNHIVNSPRELATAKSATRFELYAEALPNGPGVSSPPETEEEAAARDQLAQSIWTLTNTGPTGYVQSRIAHTGYVLCEATVSRTLVNTETGKKEPITPVGRFLTSDGDLILKYYTGPALAGFQRAARKLNNRLGLVVSRRPELVQRVARQGAAVVKQAVAAIPYADTRQAAALAAGSSSNDDEAATA